MPRFEPGTAAAHMVAAAPGNAVVVAAAVAEPGAAVHMVAAGPRMVAVEHCTAHRLEAQNPVVRLAEPDLGQPGCRFGQVFDSTSFCSLFFID